MDECIALSGLILITLEEDKAIKVLHRYTLLTTITHTSGSITLHTLPYMNR